MPNVIQIARFSRPYEGGHVIQHPSTVRRVEQAPHSNKCRLSADDLFQARMINDIILRLRMRRAGIRQIFNADTSRPRYLRHLFQLRVP